MDKYKTPEGYPTQHDIERADLLKEIKKGLRRSNPNAERMRIHTDNMQALTLIDMAKGREAPSPTSRDAKMKAAVNELKDMMGKVRSKRAGLPDSTTAGATIQVAPIVGPDQFAPAQFETKSRVLGTVMPFSKPELDLVIDRHIEGTNVPKALDPESTYDKGELQTLAIFTFKIKPDASSETVAKFLASCKKAAPCSNGSDEEEFDMAFDIIGDPGALLFRAKVFLRTDDADPIEEMARDMAEDMLNDENHPVMDNARKFLNSINFSLEFGEDLNKVINSDDSLSTVWNNARIHVDAGIPHAFREYINEASMIKMMDRLGKKKKNFAKKDSKLAAGSVIGGVIPTANAHHEVKLTYNSPQAAAGSAIRFFAPKMRKMMYEGKIRNEVQDTAKFINTTAIEEMIARVVSRKLLMGMTGLKLKNRAWFSFATMPAEPGSIQIDPIVEGGAACLESLFSVQLYGKVLMLDARVEGLNLEGLLPGSREDCYDLLRQMKLANHRDFHEMLKEMGMDKGDDDESDDDGKDPETLFDEDEFGIGGYQTKREKAAEDLEEILFNGPTSGYSNDVTDREKNEFGIVQNVVNRNAAAQVVVFGEKELNDSFLRSIVPSAAAKKPRGEDDDEDDLLDDEENGNGNTMATVIKRSRKLEMYFTSDLNLMKAQLFGADVVVYVYNPDTSPVAEFAEALKTLKDAVDEDLKMYSATTDLVKRFSNGEGEFKVLLVSANSPQQPSNYSEVCDREGTQFFHVNDPSDPQAAAEVVDRVTSIVENNFDNGKGKKANNPWDFY